MNPKYRHYSHLFTFNGQGSDSGKLRKYGKTGRYFPVKEKSGKFEQTRKVREFCQCGKVETMMMCSDPANAIKASMSKNITIISFSVQTKQKRILHGNTMKLIFNVK